MGLILMSEIDRVSMQDKGQPTEMEECCSRSFGEIRLVYISVQPICRDGQ